ncbi:hypothetical protein EDC65_0118 [Stella humosa]|uniref:Phage integrase family protein n=2 Tax=Stella humosa TaxID=94 RepID=A0A3N1MB43_9PROT|nr:hypothetical protein [Stella humosa]ROQ03082.1 hypothetical protein EDC65_0118 [Stella humosa]BBK34237.1 hypothetical protein STHU_48710 [Stella humosa]
MRGGGSVEAQPVKKPIESSAERHPNGHEAGGPSGKHRFRYLKASFTTALAHVAPGRVVQQFARHQSFETTQLYLLVADSATRAAVDWVSGRRAIRDVDLTRPIGEVATKSTTKPRKRAAGDAGK